MSFGFWAHGLERGGATAAGGIFCVPFIVLMGKASKFSRGQGPELAILAVVCVLGCLHCTHVSVYAFHAIGSID